MLKNYYNEEKDRGSIVENVPTDFLEKHDPFEPDEFEKFMTQFHLRQEGSTARSGDLVIFDSPVKFENGKLHQRVIYRGNAVEFLSTAGEFLKIPGWKTLGHVIYNNHNRNGADHGLDLLTG